MAGEDGALALGVAMVVAVGMLLLAFLFVTFATTVGLFLYTIIPTLLTSYNQKKKSDFINYVSLVECKNSIVIHLQVQAKHVGLFLYC
jgi:hypothetical protein